MGLSLWIVPDTPTAHKLDNIMKMRPASKSPSSQESYPHFHPHITLASLPPDSVVHDVETVVLSLAKVETPPKCIFSSVDVGSHYYRSVYVAIKQTSELINMHKQVHDMLGVEPKTPAFPHMSLCYITDADAEVNGERQAYYDALRDGGKMQIHDDEPEETRVNLDCGSSQEKDWVDHFEAHEIWAVRCEGLVEGWEILQRFPLAIA